MIASSKANSAIEIPLSEKTSQVILIGKLDLTQGDLSGSVNFSIPFEYSPGEKPFLLFPKEAPEDSLKIQVIIKKEGNVISTQDLDFKISRAGFFKAAMC